MYIQADVHDRTVVAHKQMVFFAYANQLLEIITIIQSSWLLLVRHVIRNMPLIGPLLLAELGHHLRLINLLSLDVCPS